MAEERDSNATRVSDEGDAATVGFSPAAGPEERPFAGIDSRLTTLAEALGAFPMPTLRGAADTEYLTTLASGSEATGESPAARPGGAERYQILGEIARGGMGAVLRGHDADLGRELAVKVLLERHRGQPDLIRRFVAEARIGGQLQHPGIVPVYELGAFADRRPYFTMKLVRGRTLADLVAARADPAEDAPRFLAIFEQVCQAMAYAHTRGVIHRDLKPLNIMVGAFGEVQVMDWGLAKVLGGAAGAPAAEDGPAEPRIERGDGGPMESQAGSILGTIAYMAPEQARGEVAALDERADVFGLGAILCELLTGAPPFAKSSGGADYRKAAAGDLSEADARLDGCGADAELVVLAKSCLAAEREARPRDAGAVAGAVTAYLAGVRDRLRAAEIAGVEARARVEQERQARILTEAKMEQERRARRLTASLAAAVVAIVALGAGGWAWVRRERAAREAATAREVNAALDEASVLRGRARTAAVGDLAPWNEAVAAARRASALLARGDGSPDLARRVREVSASLARERDEVRARAEATERDRRLLRRIAALQEPIDRVDHTREDGTYAVAFREAGIDVDALPAADAGARIAARPGAVELAAALDQWIFARLSKSPPDPDGARHLLAVAQAADPDPWRRRLREALSRNDVPELRRLADAVSDPAALPVESVKRLAYGLNRYGRDPAAAIALLQPVQWRHPDDFWVNCDLALYHLNLSPPRADDAIRFYSAAIAIRPGFFVGWQYLGRALQMKGKLEEAVVAMTEANRLAPDVEQVRGDFTALLREAGRPEVALAALREGVRLKPEGAAPHGNLGLALLAQGDRAAGLAEVREAVRLDPSARNLNAAAWPLIAAGATVDLVAGYRTAVERTPDDPGPRLRLALALLLDGDRAGYRRACAATVERFAESKDNLVGDAARGPLVAPDALDDLAIPVRLAEFAVERQPNYPWWQHVAGLASYRAGRWEQAVERLNASLRIGPDWNAAALNWPILALAHHRLGHADEARAWLGKARGTRGARARRVAPTSILRPHVYWYDRAQFLLTLREADELIDGRPSDPFWRLPAVLRGEESPRDAADAAELAYLAYDRRLDGAAARLFADAFADDPALAADLDARNRDHAARAAIAAGCGMSLDDPAPDGDARASLRARALDWLQADRAAWARRAEADRAAPEPIRALLRWQADADFLPVRDPDALALLPEAERDAWQAFWSALARQVEMPQATAAPK